MNYLDTPRKDDMTLLPVLKPVMKYNLSSSISGGVLGLLDFLPPALRTGGFAVSTSRLFGSHSGPLVRLRRGSDSVEQDFGLGKSRVVGTDISGFGASCFATTRYDQIGANNAVQTTASMQPAVAASDPVVATFDGVNDYWTCSTDTGNYTDNFTIAMWAKYTTGAYKYLCGRRDVAAQYELATQSSNSKLVLYSGANYAYGSTAIPSGVWVHIAVVVAGGLAEFFLNGVSDSAKQTFAVTSQPAAAYVIGARKAADGNWAGQMGDHIVLANPLAAAQILQVYNATKGVYGL